MAAIARFERYNGVAERVYRASGEENDTIVEQQPETIEQPSNEEPSAVATRPAVLSERQVLGVFLAFLVLGVLGTLWGIVPLVALAMIGPVVVTFLA